MIHIRNIAKKVGEWLINHEVPINIDNPLIYLKISRRVAHTLYHEHFSLINKINDIILFSLKFNQS